jgi:hypothetical protein
MLRPALLIMAALIALPLAGQEFRGTITGTVIDQTGAPVPNATIEVRGTDTTSVTEVKSNEAGAYSVPFLAPGFYKLTVSAKGFKQAVRDSIELHASDKLQIDVKLEVGVTSETITVTAGSEQLQTATATLGQVMNEQEIKDLPVLGRNVYMAAALAAGLNTGLYNEKVSQFGRPFDGAAAQMSIGGLGSQYQIYLDGIPNAPEERASAAIYIGFVPSPDAVEEVNLQTNLYDAQYGHTSGAVVNTVLRGGTNQLHGSVYEFFRNTDLNGNQFESNAAGLPTTVMHWNQPGFVASGPVYIPKKYDGRDKTFFMVSWELVRNVNPTPFTGSVPTAAERTGDFSGLTQSNGQPILIYDPLTTTLTNGQYLRTQFPNNIIPSNRINPVGKALMNEYPLPNIPGTAGGFNNYVNSPNSQEDKYNSLAVRIDHQINDKNRITGTAFNNVRHQIYPTAGFPAESSPGYLHYRNNHGAGVDWIDTISPTTVLDVKYGFIFHPFQLKYDGDDYDLTKLGFPQSFISILPHENFPGTSMSAGYTGLQNAASQFSTTVDHSLSGTLNKVMGKHSFKTGAELFIMLANNIVPESSLGAFSFSAGFSQQNALTGAAAAGSPLASMLLGYPSGGSVNYNIQSAFEQRYYGFFAQDDWRISPRLTVNLGLRWDYESPMSERYDRQNRGFDFTDSNPLQSQVTGLTLKGGLLFTNSQNPLPFKKDLNNWQPRAGFSFRATQNTVLRGGFGVMFPPTFNTGNSNGFSVSTAYVSTTDNVTPANFLSNPFPTGIVAPPGSSLGLSTLLGQGFTFADPTRTIPKVFQYSLGLQQQLPQHLLLELAYAGNYAQGLPVSKGINSLPSQFFSLGSVALTASVPNPMAGLLPNSSLNSATTPFQNLLVPYPEFGGITEQYRALGSSLYNSMQVAVEKRLSAGLQARVSFTWDKIMQETGYLNNQDSWSNLARIQSSEPNKLINVSVTYMLPLFQSGTGLAHKLLGGWEANTILRYSDGYLIGAPGGAYSSGVNPKLTSGQSYSQWFDTCSLSTAGVRQNCVNASQPVAFLQLPPFTLATLSGTLPGIRTQIPVIVDFSLFKTFPIKERVKMQIRANAYNVANTPQFGGPNTSFGSSNFGVIALSQVNDARVVELALKLNF